MSMIERVARALCAADKRDPDELVAYFFAPEHPSPQWEEYRRVARAAVMAMREPTAAMRLAAYPMIDSDSRGKALTVFEAMIDAALEGRP